MPDAIKDVKSESSSDSVKVDSQSTDDLAKTKADNERLKGALSSLQTERDEIRTRLDRLEQVEAKYGELSAQQEAERKRLERGQDNIDDQIDELKRKPEARPWFTHLERELAKATKLGTSQAAIERAADLLEELADELADDAVSKDGMKEFEGMTDEKIFKLIKPYMGQFETKSPYIKTKKAFKAWKADMSFKKEKAEAKKKEAEASSTAEGNGRQARETSTQEIMGKKDLSIADKVALREKYGIVQRSR